MVVFAYAWVVSGLRPFTAPSLVAVVGGGAMAIAVGARLPPVAEPVRLVVAAGRGWVWAVLAVALASWELQSFLQHPRREHPTLSSLANTALASHPPRALALVAWLAAAAWLARR